MEIVNAYKEMLNRYAEFTGRTTRAAYWYAVLGNIMVSLVIGLVVGLLMRIWRGFSFITYLYSLAILIPGLAVSVRRLHDVGKSGTYLLIGLIPVVGWILLLLALCRPSVSVSV